MADAADRRNPVGERPRAILFTLDGGEPIELILPDVRPVVYLPSRVEGSDFRHQPTHREFRLDATRRNLAMRWWRVYNNGRTCSPEDGFVYFEVSRG